MQVPLIQKQRKRYTLSRRFLIPLCLVLAAGLLLCTSDAGAAFMEIAVGRRIRNPPSRTPVRGPSRSSTTPSDAACEFEVVITKGGNPAIPAPSSIPASSPRASDTTPGQQPPKRRNHRTRRPKVRVQRTPQRRAGRRELRRPQQRGTARLARSSVFVPKVEMIQLYRKDAQISGTLQERYNGRLKFVPEGKTEPCVISLTKCKKTAATETKPEKYTCKTKNFRTTAIRRKLRSTSSGSPTTNDCKVQSKITFKAKEGGKICQQALPTEWPRTTKLKSKLEERHSKVFDRLGMNEYRFLACAMEYISKSNPMHPSPMTAEEQVALKGDIYGDCYTRAGNTKPITEAGKQHFSPPYRIYSDTAHQKRGFAPGAEGKRRLKAAWKAVWTEDKATALLATGIKQFYTSIGPISENMRTASDFISDTVVNKLATKSTLAGQNAMNKFTFLEPDANIKSQSLNYYAPGRNKIVYRISFGCTNLATYEDFLTMTRDILLLPDIKILWAKITAVDRLDNAVFAFHPSTTAEVKPRYDKICKLLEPYYSAGIISDLAPAFQYQGCPWLAMSTYWMGASHGQTLTFSFIEVFKESIPKLNSHGTLTLKDGTPVQYINDVQNFPNTRLNVVANQEYLDRVELFLLAWEACNYPLFNKLPQGYPTPYNIAELNTQPIKNKPAFLGNLRVRRLPTFRTVCWSDNLENFMKALKPSTSGQSPGVTPGRL